MNARREWLLHVLLLFNVAIAQPLYGVLSHGTTFFVAHEFIPVQLVLFALALSLAMPAALAGLVLLLRPIGARAFRAAQLLCVWSLASLALLSALNRIDTNAAVPLAIAAIGALLFTALYVSSQRLRDFLRFASVVAIVFPLTFLFFSPVSDLLGARFLTDLYPPTVELEILDAPVFLLVFDELATASLVDGNVRIDAKNFPNFARLAKHATWYRNASANGMSTEIAIPSILTGRHPERDLAPNATAHPVNLFTLLAPGYEIVAFQHLIRLCPESICHDREARRLNLTAAVRDVFVVYDHIVVPLRLREKLPQIEGRWSKFSEDPAAPTEAQGAPFGRKAKPHFETFLAAIDASARGKFFFLHSLLPHIPYVFLPDGRSYASDDSFFHLPGWEPTRNIWIDDEDLVAQGYQRALFQTQMVDGLLGRFLDRLDEFGLFDASLIVVTSDHGANFTPGAGRRGFDADTVGTGLMVPLFVKVPGQQRGERTDRNVQSIDIAPTMLDLLGRVPSGIFDGVSMIDAANEPPMKQPLPWSGDRRAMLANQTLRLLEAATHKQQLFQFSDSAADYSRLAKFGDAIGLPIDRFEIGAEENAEAVLDAQPTQPGVEFVGASIEGAIEGDATALRSPFVAIARNGRVVAFAKLFVKNGQSRFHAIVPPEFVGAPDDEIRFYTIAQGDPSGASMQLFPLRPREVATEADPAAR